jgi:hypothetical protein
MMIDSGKNILIIYEMNETLQTYPAFHADRVNNH